MKRIHMRIEELLKERGISKNQICKDLDIPRGNFNRYCRDQFQRIDANLVVKLCGYLNCDIHDLLILQEGEH
jgi:putative transcriptional regulator